MTCAQPIPGAGGVGFAGLIAALELRRAGCESFVIFERGDEVGGVWMARENADFRRTRRRILQDQDGVAEMKRFELAFPFLRLRADSPLAFIDALC